MKELLQRLLETPNKSMEIKDKDKYFVEYAEVNDDMDLLKLNLYKNKEEYKGVVMEKGLTFPIPKKGDIILVEKIYLKYNQIFQFQVYIEGNVIPENNEIKAGETQTVFSFEQNDIFNTLSKISNIKLKKSCSTIFVVESKLGNTAKVKSLNDLKKYSLEFSQDYYDKIKKDSFLWLNFHELRDDKVEVNKFTTFEIMNDEQMVRILNLINFDNLAIFKVIDVNKDNIIVINVNYNIFNINKNNERLKGINIELCALIIISNYKEEDGKIKLTKESFIYKLKQELHYLDVHINSKAILKLYILDYNINGNKYDTIINLDENKNITISSNEEYLIISNAYPTIYEYFPCNIGMFNSKNEKIEQITFKKYRKNN